MVPRAIRALVAVSSPGVVVPGLAVLPGLELPRGAVTEVCGPPSSGRTSLVYAVLAAGMARGEYCAFIDAADVLDPASAAAAGLDLHRLLWVRCGGNVLHALKAADMVAHAGGFGVVILDLGETAPEIARRISLSTWFRLRRAVEHTPAVLVVLDREPQLKQCASMVLESKTSRIHWSGSPGVSYLLRGAELELAQRKPLRIAGGDLCLRVSV